MITKILQACCHWATPSVFIGFPAVCFWTTQHLRVDAEFAMVFYGPLGYLLGSLWAVGVFVRYEELS